MRLSRKVVLYAVGSIIFTVWVGADWYVGYQNSLLFSAAQTGDINTAIEGLRHGGDPAARHEGGRSTDTPMNWARTNRFPQIVHLYEEAIRKRQHR